MTRRPSADRPVPHPHDDAALGWWPWHPPVASVRAYLPPLTEAAAAAAPVAHVPPGRPAWWATAPTEPCAAGCGRTAAAVYGVTPPELAPYCAACRDRAVRAVTRRQVTLAAAIARLSSPQVYE